MSDKTKSRIHLLIFLNFAVLIGWYFWTEVRPNLIYAACSDVATRSSSVSDRYNLNFDADKEYRQQRDDCLMNATAKK